MDEKILIIEDDPDAAKILRHTLESEGYQAEVSDDIERSLAKAQSLFFDLVILDLILPKGDGLEFCRRLKRDPNTASIPILILSSRKEEADVVVGLELGAEDYVTKPFSPRIFLSRVRAILRRAASFQPKLEQENIVHYEDFRIDPRRFEIKCGNRALTLTRSEFRILRLLFGSPGWVYTRKQILEAVHGKETPVTIRSVDVMVVNLRHKLGEKGALLETVRGIGYRAKEVENDSGVKEPVVKESVVKKPIVKEPIVKESIVKESIVKESVS